MRSPLFLFLVLLSSSALAQHIDFSDADFTKPDSIASLYIGHSLEDREVLTQKLTAGLTTDLDKFRSIFKWIAENITYDVELFHKNIENTQKFKSNRKKLARWRTQFARQTLRNTILEKLAVCDGYASVLEEMCGIANIPCRKITGYARTTLANKSKGNNHAWNMVQINNKWYLSDPTWATGGVGDDDRFRRRFDESYFLADPHLMKLKHFPQDSTWFLLKDKPDFAEFNSYPLVYSEGFSRAKINQFFPTTGFITVKAGKPVTFRISSNLPSLKRLGITIDDGKKEEEILAPSVLRDAEGLYAVNHTFTKKGRYQVELFVNYRYVLAYEVTVR